MHSLLGKARLILDSFDADSGALSLTELAESEWCCEGDGASNSR